MSELTCRGLRSLPNPNPTCDILYPQLYKLPESTKYQAPCLSLHFMPGLSAISTNFTVSKCSVSTGVLMYTPLLYKFTLVSQRYKRYVVRCRLYFEMADRQSASQYNSLSLVIYLYHDMAVSLINIDNSHYMCFLLYLPSDFNCSAVSCIMGSTLVGPVMKLIPATSNVLAYLSVVYEVSVSIIASTHHHHPQNIILVVCAPYFKVGVGMACHGYPCYMGAEDVPSVFDSDTLPSVQKEKFCV